MSIEETATLIRSKGKAMANDGIKRRTRVRIFFIAGCAVLVVALTGAISLSQHNAPPEDSYLEASPNAQPPVATTPTHYYAMQTGDEYGYEAAVSEEQRQAGLVTSPLVMVRYAGEKQGKYQIFLTDHSVKTVFDCEKPCEFVRVRTFVNEEETAVEQMRRVKGSIAYYAMEDAMHGQLAQHFAVSRGVRVPHWY